MNNPMAASNVRIINEMKKFLSDISEDSLKRLDYVVNSQDFSRKRILSFTTIVLLLMNMLKRSLSVELQEFFESLSSNFCCSKQAFSKQRRKLKSTFFHDWNHQFTKSFYHEYQGIYQCWKGFKLLSIDGSSVCLPDTEEIKDHYGIMSNQTEKVIPVARICVLYDVLNQIALRGLLHPYRVSEEEVCFEILENQELSDSILLFDRGYPSYWLIYLLLEHNTHFVMRAACNANNIVKGFIKSEDSDITLDFYPPYSSLQKLLSKGKNVSKETAVKIRLVKVILDTGEVEILITNLFDTELYSISDMKQVYNLRWGIETYYGYMKEELQLGQFSGLIPLCIEQDFAANLFLFNLHSIIEKQSKPHLKKINKGRKYDYKVNKNVSIAFLKHRVVKLFLIKESESILYELEKLFCKYLEPIRHGRKFPRKKKRIPNTKHYTLTNYKRAI